MKARHTLAAGSNHLLFIHDGELYGQGSNKYGQLGLVHPSVLKSIKEREAKERFYSTHGFWHPELCRTKNLIDDDKDTPVLIPFFEKKKVLSVHACMNHSLVLCEDGLYAMGNNALGQLGLGDKKPTMIMPTKIDTFNDMEILSVKTSKENTFVSCSVDGDIKNYMMGTNFVNCCKPRTEKVKDTWQKTPIELPGFKDTIVQDVALNVGYSLFLCDNTPFILDCDGPLKKIPGFENEIIIGLVNEGLSHPAKHVIQIVCESAIYNVGIKFGEGRTLPPVNDARKDYAAFYAPEGEKILRMIEGTEYCFVQCTKSAHLIDLLETFDNNPVESYSSLNIKAIASPKFRGDIGYMLTDKGVERIKLTCPSEFTVLATSLEEFSGQGEKPTLEWRP